MKYFCTLAILCCLSLAAQAQTKNPTYDKALADSLGADDYGMKSYVLVLLKTGTAKIEDQQKVAELFRGHLSNIGKLAEEGKLVVAGPLGKNDKAYRGIFILNVATVEEAAALVQTDPAIKEKLLAVELYPWYGSAALPVYLQTHSKIEKIKP
ncbi:MAG: YciI family protein [Hymenobacteraceae bacterium]|nr:YciI family protein [Hymenobacteraceae bacterium]